MSSRDHEGVIELFRREPKLVAELLGAPLRIELPPYSGARVESGALTQLNPAELRADLVIALHEGGRPTLGVVLQMQRERDEDSSRGRPTSLPSPAPALRSVPGRRHATRARATLGFAHHRPRSTRVIPTPRPGTELGVALAAAGAAQALDRDHFLLYFGLISAALRDDGGRRSAGSG